MSLKPALLKVYYLPCLSKDKTDANQKRIRDIEWDAVKEYIPKGTKFLDVGCGTGYAMKKAAEELGCECYGVDPDPGEHGVGRYSTNTTQGLSILKGEAEALPFEDGFFDLVYCSHVLEHVNDEHQSLLEMKRVLKPGGIVIIGMPTATMALISLVTEILFTSHQRFVNIVFQPFINTGKTPLINLFLPPSHSAHRAKTVLFDLKYYRVTNWRNIVSQVFDIKQTLLPALYPFPQYWQLFRLRLNSKHGSSVFFIAGSKRPS